MIDEIGWLGGITILVVVVYTLRGAMTATLHAFDGWVCGRQRVDVERDDTARAALMPRPETFQSFPEGRSAMGARGLSGFSADATPIACST